MSQEKLTADVDNADDSSDLGLSTRLSFIQGDESTRNFARRVGVKEGTLRSVLKGTRPSVDFVVKVAQSTGASLEWLATGQGTPFSSAASKSEATQSAISHINRDIFVMVSEAVARAHEAENFLWHPGAVAAEQMDAYYEVLETVWEPTDLGEVSALIPWIEYNLRGVLRAAKEKAHGTGSVNPTE